MEIKKELIKLFIVIPAVMGFIVSPLILVSLQLGQINMNNSLFSKILIIYMAVCMYIFYVMWIKKKIKETSNKKKAINIYGDTE